MGLTSKALDFVLVFPQADLDVPVYMKLPADRSQMCQTQEAAHVAAEEKTTWTQAGFR